MQRHHIREEQCARIDIPYILLKDEWNACLALQTARILTFAARMMIFRIFSLFALATTRVLAPAFAILCSFTSQGRDINDCENLPSTYARCRTVRMLCTGSKVSICKAQTRYVYACQNDVNFPACGKV